MSGDADAPGRRHFPFLKSYPLSLQRGSDPDSPRLTGQVVGTIDSERIIVGGIGIGQLAGGDEVVARMVVGSEALGFRTQVMEVCAGGPSVLLLLAMPEQVETINLRKGERLNVFVPADVHYSRSGNDAESAGDVALLQGRMLNLSREGCCLSTKRPLSVNHPIRLAFALPGARHTYRLPAQVLRHMGTPREGVFVQGVQFEKQTEHLPVLADLQQWITQNLSYAAAN